MDKLEKLKKDNNIPPDVIAYATAVYAHADAVYKAADATVEYAINYSAAYASNGGDVFGRGVNAIMAGFVADAADLNVVTKQADVSDAADAFFIAYVNNRK